MPATALSSLSLDLLKTLVVFEETGLVEETARRMGMTQAGVSLQLKKLEEQAGIPLFQPLGRKKALTDFARGLCRSIAPPLRDIDLRLQEASDFQSHPEMQTLRIGCRSELMPRLAGLLRFQGRTIYRTMSEAESIQALKEGQIDVAVVSDKSHVDQSDLLQRALFEEKAVLIAPAKWTEAKNWAELQKDPDFLWERPVAGEEAPFLKPLAKFFDRNVKDFDLRFSSPHWNSTRDLVQAGAAWAIVPESSSKEAGRRIIIPEADVPGLRHVLVVRELEGRAFLKTLLS